ncbi:hypothetical protein [Pseudodesulfovibrio sp.]|uniref:hypothetical protein n=1 Tax=Pseudodesulfovibrio sp. TaxID=2035812 RepID=UPI002617109F|nr:hypothetical protein [Pseudodesulfovibrio sp.]MDD3313510.1 hypothetical protein [Pseudodesulfovibrio sp.]
MTGGAFLGYLILMVAVSAFRMLRSLRAAPWPLATGSASLGLGLALKGAGAACWVQGDAGLAVALGCWGAGWLVVALFALADAAARCREYRRIRAILLRYGYSNRILEPLASSRCQRDAALLAARETGHGGRARAYFASLGYRWYHILPDRVVRNPFIFLRPGFLRASFLPGKKGRG